MHLSHKKRGLMDWWINQKQSCQITTWSSVCDYYSEKILLYKNRICLFCVSLCEWAALCHVLHTQVCALAPLLVFNSACCLTIWGQTLRTINNPFIILFEKTIVKYTDTEISSLLPVFFSSSCDLRQLRCFKCVLLPPSVYFYPSK